MFEKPLFQDNILFTIYKYFSHYLSYQNWAWQFFGAMFLLYIIYKLLMYKNTITYAPFFPTEKYYFSWKRNSDKFGMIFLLLCFSFYILGLYSQELTFFSNYDTMGLNTMLLHKNGVLPFWGISKRLAPIAFWEVNIFYAISHNFKVINIMIAGQIILLIYLSYILLNFIPVFKRLYILGVLIISPVIWGTANIIFSERMLLLYIVSSFICLKNYIEKNKSYNLWFAILMINFAIYTKESTIIFYSGILIYSFFYNLWNEKIKINNFIHPIKTARTFPLELLILCSFVIFAYFYLITIYSFLDNKYISERQISITKLLYFYKFELLIIICASFLAIKNIVHKNIQFIPIAVIVGSILFTTVIIFLLKLYPTYDYVKYRQYYLTIPYFFSIIYLLNNLKQKKLIFISTMIIVYSIKYDIFLYQNEIGKYYRENAEFISQQLNKHPLNIYISQNSEEIPYIISCWSAIYKHYFPTAEIKFSSPIFPPEYLYLETWKKLPMHQINYQQLPQSGDFYVIKKTDKYHEDLAVIKDIQHELIYQNKLFEVYKIK